MTPVNRVLKGAWAEVAPWIANWNAERQQKQQAKQMVSTRFRILKLFTDDRSAKPFEVAQELGLPHDRTRKAMQRLYKENLLGKDIGGVYRAVLKAAGTKCCIITPPSPFVAPGSLLSI